MIEGWAYDAFNPSSRVIVEAVTSGGKRVSSIANLARDDVASAGHGDGKYGYVLNIFDIVGPAESVIVRFADSKIAITDEPIEFVAERALLIARMPVPFFEQMQLMASRISHLAELASLGEGEPSDR